MSGYTGFHQSSSSPRQFRFLSKQIGLSNETFFARLSYVVWRCSYSAAAMHLRIGGRSIAVRMNISALHRRSSLKKNWFPDILNTTFYNDVVCLNIFSTLSCLLESVGNWRNYGHLKNLVWWAQHLFPSKFIMPFRRKRNIATSPCATSHLNRRSRIGNMTDRKDKTRQRHRNGALFIFSENYVACGKWHMTLDT